MLNKSRMAILLAATLAAPAAWAHAGHHDEGLLATLLHTVTQHDHLIGVVALVILLAAVQGWRGRRPTGIQRERRRHDI